uniref:Uncharacterized protein n=1 Tax=uncultured marine thaumarchaeote KM3_04_H06 TaxID=1455967 RepID=A0A075G482_9ARCH|nr:hypothetical protein [uncultured marine thaumarchaeote KM3_04_H06]
MLVRKKHVFGVICITIISVVIIFGDQINPEYTGNDQLVDISDVFHIRLADPELYENGIYHESFVLEDGVYEFRFTPNGDSPRLLSVTLVGNSILFSEDFMLEGTPHETNISLYYTWDYEGVKKIQVFEDQQVDIKINPNGNLVGPVSVELIPTK